MTYLWINPVSERMISVEALERMLEKHDLTRVVCRESWGEIVLRKYRELLEHADGTFADARCPAAVSLVHSLQPGIRIADIEPDPLCERAGRTSGSRGWQEDHHDSMPDLSRHGK